VKQPLGRLMTAGLVVLALGGPAYAGSAGGNGDANPFAVHPPANTNAFARTPPANTNAFSKSPQASTNALGTKGPGRTTAFGHNGHTTTAGGSSAIGAANANRAANSFGTATDTGASPVGGHHQAHSGAD
jgi:hypothetical protein